ISKSILIDGKNISYDYFYASYENKHEQAVLEGAISILSILTSTFLLLGELSDGEIITSYNISGKSNNVPFFGSGVFQHPIEKSSLEKLYHEIGHYQFERLQWRYSNFVTSNDFVIQLFKGCNLLDYIAEISENILWKKINNRKSSKSNIIYTILIQLNLSIERTEILCLLFPELNWRKEETNSINDLKFDFYELRDSHVHRGQILEVDSDFPRYRNAIVALDEVIRIILPHLGVIKNWSLQNKDSIRSINAEGFVKERQKVMNWNKILE
ncbi:MAG: hypothetical protein GW834_15800, partial [Cyanobacteria bacterium]|nr:hypothetical protein [Cyanobacteria bacterium CG_2015-09_32_10]